MLIIAEKPSVARKIASFLSKGKYKSIRFSKKAYYYVFSLNNQKVYVVSALGHLFTLADNKKMSEYPSFDYRWIPAHEVDRIYTKKSFINMIKKFSDEKEIIIATDYDIEGELIGYNILRFILGRDNANRMIFSAITYKDIWNSFLNRKSSINRNFAIAGETRHIVDWIYGINLSRALTDAIRTYKKGIILSIGRVQGPTLKIILRKEEEIRNFIPEEYYIIEGLIDYGGFKIKVKYSLPKINNKEIAREIVRRLSGRIVVKKVMRKIESLNPPHPYNLTDLQTDAYKYYKILPKRTLDIAQRLYELGYISYPRTSSQKLPSTVDFRYILKQLEKFVIYKYFALALLEKEELKPNNGKKDDVHPAIHPTGVLPKGLSKQEWLIYDLIVRRFLATFSNAVVISKYNIEFEDSDEIFTFSYKKIYKIGWLKLYWRFVSKDYLDIEFREGEILKVKKYSIRKRKTKPPSRYNPASLVNEMEKLNIGTKATRADIIQILYKREYIKGRSIRITRLGEKIIEIFDKYIPEILDVSLTRKLEDNLMKIEKGDLDLRDKVIKEVTEIVRDVCEDIRRNKEKIGKELYEAYKLVQS